MKKITTERRCSRCHGSGERSSMYRFGLDVAGIGVGIYILTNTVGLWFWIAIFLIVSSIVSILHEMKTDNKAKCKHCDGTGKIILEEKTIE